MYAARDYLENAIILDGDLILYNKDILRPEFEKSGYNAIWTQDYTNEWLMQVKDNHVISCSRDGGKEGWQLFSISRWNKEDGEKLRKHLEIEFVEKNNRQIYWDDVAMFCHFDAYDLGIMEMDEKDVMEIDSLEELIAVDPTYLKYKEGMGEK